MTALHLPLPPKELSPNARIHWAKKAAATYEYRSQCGWIARVAGLKFRGPVRIEYLFRFCDRRRRDLDNLIKSMKPALDGLRDAGVIAEDSTDEVPRLSATYEKAADANEVVLTIAPNPPAAKRLPREATERVWEEETRCP